MRDGLKLCCIWRGLGPGSLVRVHYSPYPARARLFGGLPTLSYLRYYDNRLHVLCCARVLSDTVLGEVCVSHHSVCIEVEIPYCKNSNTVGDSVLCRTQ